MKTLVTNYTFDKTAKTITFTDYGTIYLERILIVVNATDQIIIYNFADTGKGGTVATNVLTLEYDTTSMDNTDKLLIYYDDTSATQAVSAASLPLASGAATSAKQDTIIGHVDGLETLAGTIDADTSNISTKIDTLAGAVAGTEMQVDVVGALPAGTNAIGKLTANSGVDIGDVDVTSLTLGTYAVDDSAMPATPQTIPVSAEYRSTATTYADGDVTVLQSDVNGNLKNTMGTLIAGEDLTANVLKVEQRFSYTNVVADASIKSGAGFLHSVTLSSDAAATAGTLILYDNTAESGTVIHTFTFEAAYATSRTVILDVAFATGLYAGFTTTGDVSTTFSYR